VSRRAPAILRYVIGRTWRLDRRLPNGRFRRILLKKSAARPVLRCAAAALLAGGLVSVGRSEVGASLFRG